ncbi:MAG: hypothetical protein ACTSQE_17320 [Candidatus Heimdallarchaeaceae archaeon]
MTTWKEMIEFKQNLIKYLEEKIVEHRTTLVDDYNLTPNDIQNDEYPEDMSSERIYIANYLLGEYENCKDLLRRIKDGL